MQLLHDMQRVIAASSSPVAERQQKFADLASKFLDRKETIEDIDLAAALGSFGTATPYRATTVAGTQAISLTVSQVLALHHALAARASWESLGECAGDRHTERGNRVADVPLRSDWGILGVGNHGIEEAF
jgi:hypothetical protein